MNDSEPCTKIVKNQEIIHYDALGRQINVNDIVLRESNSGNAMRLVPSLVIKLTPKQVRVSDSRKWMTRPPSISTILIPPSSALVMNDMIKTLTRSQIVKFIHDGYPFIIKELSSPTEDILHLAVRKDKSVIGFIQDPVLKAFFKITYS